jgi:branched-chain amino acid transport system permease protein
MNSAPAEKLPGLRLGAIGGVSLVLLSLIGMVEAFNQREIISKVISMGQSLLLFIAVFISYAAASRARRHGGAGRVYAAGLVAGLTMSAILALLVLIGNAVNLRQVLINASPLLYMILTFGLENLAAGILAMVLSGALVGAAAAALCMLPELPRRMIITAASTLAVVGMLQDLVYPVLSAWGPLSALNDLLFPGNGLSVSGAIGLFILVAVGSAVWSTRGAALKTGIADLPPPKKRSLKLAAIALGAVILLVLPHVLGLFLSEVMTIVGLYILLGLGLNIVVGFAGLLDLGYVAFFAIGSYTTAILTSPEIGFFQLNFWQALPFAVIFGILAGVMLGVPVLNMRGDYLAIATLGFGEIIRILVLSDFLRPWLGGAQGIGKIPKAQIGAFEFATPQQVYYLLLAGCILVGFISWRLRDSRLGRAWMAVREDEDVAQAMGINLVATKLLAFATGAGFSALSGAIFASKIGSVYPHSFNVMISINIICVIIVGGIGSMPGVVVGALALVGLPELLREFAEYRLLVYGAALMAMMLLRPEGLWPEATHKREFHEDENGDELEPQAAPAAGSRG